MVVDNIFGAEWTNALRREIRLLFDQNKLYHFEETLILPLRYSNRTYYEGKKNDDGKFRYDLKHLLLRSVVMGTR